MKNRGEEKRGKTSFLSILPSSCVAVYPHPVSLPTRGRGT
jgi:hypothetical protein